LSVRKEQDNPSINLKKHDVRVSLTVVNQIPVMLRLVPSIS